MMKTLKLWMVMLVLSCSLISFSQEKTSAEIIDEILFSKVTKERSPYSDYNAAEDMAAQARMQLLSGNIKTADSLIKRSIELYPTTEVFEYALSQGSLPDIVGANLIMDKVIDRVKKFPSKRLNARETIGLKYEKGKLVTVVKEFDRERAYFNYIEDAYEINKFLGERKWIEYSLFRASDPVITPLSNPKLYDFELYAQLGMLVTKARFQNDFAKSVKIIEGKNLNASYTVEIRKFDLVFNQIFAILEEGVTEENYKLLLEATEEIPVRNIRSVLFFFTYAELGKITEAEAAYKKIEERFKELSVVYCAMAMLELHRKNYSQALANLAKALAIPAERSLGDAYQRPEKWLIYQLYGDIYKGLNDYEKARDNYNISLLYYPGFKKSIEGMADLEAKHAAQVSSDNTPPVIELTEPLQEQTLKITSGTSNILIKGMVKDVSGVKEVFINGQKMFTQNSGAFWGDVLIKTGINTLTIVATDISGNTAEKIVEINKPAGPVKEVIPIIAVKEKEGNNYCLLIAAQNYADGMIPSLDNPIADAIRLKIILKTSYSFSEKNIISLFNPSTNDIKRQLLELSNIIQPEDNLVIFYAGHGIWVEKEKKGYWLMTDAQYKDVNSWLPNKTILDLIAKLPARHTLLITDACFSGSVFKTRGIQASAPEAIKQLDSKISRVAITSGNDTEVPDQSVFMKYLVKALSQNKEQYLTAQKMFITDILEAVMSESKTEPRYGTLELAGHVGGDFIFTKK